MGNIDVTKIRKQNFEIGSPEEKVETYCIKYASEHTDEMLELYKKLEASRNGRYINSDLMKMVYPFYAKNIINRRKYNMSVTNSAAVLTNEAFRRKIQSNDIKRCIFVVGPYGAGKSFFVHSLFEEDSKWDMENSMIYEGSITPPAFEEKIQFAIDNGITPDIIALNPSLELSLRNIKERARITGRDVVKKEVIDKFSNFYKYLKQIIEKHEDIAYIIYNKESNITIKFDSGSQNLEDLNHGTEEEISKKYDQIIQKLKIEGISL